MLLLTNLIVAPPRGERGLKPILRQIAPRIHGRSPSWGAWIETSQATAYISILSSRSPSWGAWIETWMLLKRKWENKVAPPRGERGLKQLHRRFFAPR